MTGRQNLRYTARLNGLRRREAETAIDEVLDQVGLADRRTTGSDLLARHAPAARHRRRPGQVAGPPDPRRADDRRSTRSASIEILELLRRLVHERGLSIMLSSHLLSQVQSVCDRIGIFARAALIGSGPSTSSRPVRRRDAHDRGRTRAADAADVKRASTSCATRVGRVRRGAAEAAALAVHVRPPSERACRQDILVAAVEHGLRLTALGRSCRRSTTSTAPRSSGRRQGAG
jgi:ABC-2 type transport system ATP-binding protein